MATAISSKLSPFFFSSSRRCLRFSSAPQNHDFAISKRTLNPNALIDLLSSDPDPISAANIFRWASRQRNFRQTPATYAHIVSKLGLAGKTQEMEEFLKEMAVKFHNPDAESSFKTLIESFCRNSKLKEALKVFEIASLNKFRLPISTCNAILSERLDFDEVVFVYKEMVKAGILPDVVTLNCLIKCLVENGMMELAVDQFERMEKKGCRPNARSFDIVIGGLCSTGRVDDAVRVWNQMLENECSRDWDFYVRIIPWFCRVCRLDEANKMFRLMKSDGFSPDLDLYSVLIGYLCEDMRLDDAIEVFEEMGKLGFTPVTCTYVDIVNAYCKLGEFTKAMCFLEENVVSDTMPYNALLQDLCDEGRVQEATNYLKKIQEMGLSDGHSWNIIINCLCREGNVGNAFKVLGRMIMYSYFPDEVTYSSIIAGFCKICSYDSALAWFRKGLTKNMSFDSKSCSDLIKGLCHMDRVREAVEVFYSNCSSKGCGLSANALNVLIQGLCVRGEVNEAIKLRSIALCSGTPSTPSTYETVVLALLDLKKENNTLAFLSQILVEGCNLDCRTYCILIYGLCDGRTSRNAALLFNRMVLDGFTPDGEMLEKIVHSVSKCSQLHLIVDSLERITEAGDMMSPSVCNIIIYGLLKEGLKSEARKFLDWMLEKGWVPDSDTHGLLIGNVSGEERHGTNEAYADGDGVSSILSEGLRGSG